MPERSPVPDDEWKKFSAENEAAVEAERAIIRSEQPPAKQRKKEISRYEPIPDHELEMQYLHETISSLDRRLARLEQQEEWRQRLNSPDSKNLSYKPGSLMFEMDRAHDAAGWLKNTKEATTALDKIIAGQNDTTTAADLEATEFYAEEVLKRFPELWDSHQTPLAGFFKKEHLRREQAGLENWSTSFNPVKVKKERPTR